MLKWINDCPILAMQLLTHQHNVFFSITPRDAFITPMYMKCLYLTDMNEFLEWNNYVISLMWVAKAPEIYLGPSFKSRHPSVHLSICRFPFWLLNSSQNLSYSFDTISYREMIIRDYLFVCWNIYQSRAFLICASSDFTATAYVSNWGIQRKYASVN